MPEALPVSAVLHAALGRPGIDKPVTFVPGKSCGSCARVANCCQAATVLTSRFGSWGDIAVASDGSRWLCEACGWAYRASDLRRAMWIIDVDGTATTPTIAEVREALAGPIATSTAIIVPTSGKRIVAPRAAWGTVTSDSGNLRWCRHHHEWLTAATRLRALGVSEAALASPSPPWPVLVATSVEHHAEIQGHWRRLAPLRADKTLLPLFQRLSREPS